MKGVFGGQVGILLEHVRLITVGEDLLITVILGIEALAGVGPHVRHLLQDERRRDGGLVDLGLTVDLLELGGLVQCILVGRSCMGRAKVGKKSGR